MMKVIIWVEEVENFVSSTLKTKYVTPEISKAWAFGGVIFAQAAGLITKEEMNELLKKYGLVWGEDDASGS